ncbi:MAG: DUF4177 domain-containing protein [Planctomycetaceae bacterium]|nr:MAG: DUF4177 domain-containing protein [Planctomycetaceae bacterium]
MFLNSAGRSATQAQEASKPTRLVWEYKVVRVNEEELNRLGAEGWEVVAAYGDVKGQSAGMRAINTIERTILKRPKAN